MVLNYFIYIHINNKKINKFFKKISFFFTDCVWVEIKKIRFSGRFFS